MALTKVQSGLVEQLAKSNMPAGTVLQVVNSYLTTTFSTSSTTYVDTGLTVTITPTSATSKILITACINNLGHNNGNLACVGLARNGSILLYNTSGGVATTKQSIMTGGGAVYTGTDRQIYGGVVSYLDNPATTSATTYKIQLLASSGTAYLNQWALNADVGGVSFITVQEIAGS